MTQSHKITSEILDIYPPNSQLFMTEEAPASFDLLPNEESLTHTMGKKRLHEFRAGRYCMRMALAELSFINASILIGENREPILPSNVVGSISHCSNLAGAIAMKNTQINSIGIDIELSQGLEDRLIPIVCTSNEISNLHFSRDRNLNAMLLFSIKESVYKCLNPLLGIWLEFHDLEIKLEDGNSYSVSFTKPEHSQINKHRFIGRYVVNNINIFTCCYARK